MADQPGRVTFLSWGLARQGARLVLLTARGQQSHAATKINSS